MCTLLIPFLSEKIPFDEINEKKKIKAFQAGLATLLKQPLTNTNIMCDGFFIDKMVTDSIQNCIVKFCNLIATPNYTYYLLNMCLEKYVIILRRKSFENGKKTCLKLATKRR